MDVREDPESGNDVVATQWWTEGLKGKRAGIVEAGWGAQWSPNENKQPIVQEDIQSQNWKVL